MTSSDATPPDAGTATESGRDRLADAVTSAEVIITTGAGGVGKTTMAAAIGLAAARRGRRALVITIDPARRLAQALGLDELASRPQRVLDDESSGSLDAMMLDMQSTFDELVDRHAASPANAAEIKANRIYQTLSSNLAGTQEYMAMEKLHELHDLDLWDLIVVDTPPTRNALDFLDAPARMTSFLEGHLLRLLLKPAAVAGKGYLKVVGFGAAAFMKVAGRVTGMELLDDLAAFFGSFDGMYEGFKERAEQVLRLLQQPTSNFVVVASPETPALREARFFVERLQQEGLHLATVVVNRVQDHVTTLPAPTLREAAAALGDDRNDRAVAAGLELLAHLEDTASRHRHDIAATLRGPAAARIVTVPRAARDVHDIDDLDLIGTHLVHDPRSRQP